MFTLGWGCVRFSFEKGGRLLQQHLLHSRLFGATHDMWYVEWLSRHASIIIINYCAKEFFTKQHGFVPAVQRKVFDHVQFPNSKQTNGLAEPVIALSYLLISMLNRISD